MKSKFAILAFILFSNCTTYIPKLPFTEEARERNIIGWYYQDYSDSEKREENISSIGQKYLDFVQRKHDDTATIYQFKIQFASLDLMILQNALRTIFYKKNRIAQARFASSRSSSPFLVTANSFEEFFKVEINKVPHFFVLITVSQESTFYKEIIVLKKEKEYLKVFKTPLFKAIEDDKKIGFYTTKTNFGSRDSEEKEYVLDSFQNLKKAIEQGRIEFEKMDIEASSEGFILNKFAKDGSINKYYLNFRE